MDRVFVGRRQEMSLLTAALEDAMDGRGRLVTLTGDAGIGKTRTAQEVAVYAESRGARVLWGRCHEAQGAPPYWPWVQPIRDYVQQRAVPELGVEMGPGTPDIAEVVPEVRERLRDLRPAPSVEPAQARFRLFDAVTAFLKRAAQTTPLVLILEDLHWADTPSLLLLEFFSHELAEVPLLVLGTYRDVELTSTHPLAHSLGELARQPFFQEILLQGLARQDVQQFMATATGVEPPEDLVQLVYLRTEGNPFFLTQIVQWLVQQGHRSVAQRAAEQAESLDIPQSVRMVIG